MLKPGAVCRGQRGVIVGLGARYNGASVTVEEVRADGNLFVRKQDGKGLVLPSNYVVSESRPARPATAHRVTGTAEAGAEDNGMARLQEEALKRERALEAKVQKLEAAGHRQQGGANDVAGRTTVSERAQTIFANLDRDQSGIVEHEELKRLMHEFGTDMELADVSSYQAALLDFEAARTDGINIESFGLIEKELLHLQHKLFFDSLQMSDVLASSAASSPVLRDVNNRTDPREGLSELTSAQIEEFWRGAIPRLAAATSSALKGIKFQKEGSLSTLEGKFGALQLGPLEMFFRGLDGLLGLPNHDTLRMMEEEHASQEPFIANNQGRHIETSPREQWDLVLPEGSGGKINTHDYDRTQQMCEDFMMHPRTLGAGLEKAEIVALRLYTGPMYAVYNKLLRRAGMNVEELLASRDRTLDDVLNQVRVEVIEHQFVTTLHAMVSGLLKLAKTSQRPPGGKTYRGISGLNPPTRFLQRHRSGGRGGVEFGFLSTTTDINTALLYLSGAEHPSLFEISTGMVDNGAELSWLSYFPGEAEVLLPPLCMLEVAGPRRYLEVASKDGKSSVWVSVWPLSLNVNVRSSTLEELRQRRKTIHLSMLSNLVLEVELGLSGLALADVYSAAKMDGCPLGTSEEDQGIALRDQIRHVVHQCRGVLQHHEELTVADFNDDAKYKQLLDEAMDLKVLGPRKLWVQWFHYWQALLRAQPRASSSTQEPPSNEAGALVPVRPSGNPSGTPDVHNLPLNSLKSDAVYYELMTRCQDMPWEKLCSNAFIDVLKIPMTIRGRELALTCSAVLANAKSVRVLSYGSFAVILKDAKFGFGQAENGESCTDGSSTLIKIRNNKSFGTHGASLLGSLQSYWSGLVTIDLSHCRLGDEGAAELNSSLQLAAPTVTALIVTNCSIGAAGARSIASLFAVCTAMRTLNVHGNEVQDEGNQVLAEQLVNRVGDLTINDIPLCMGAVAWDEERLERLAPGGAGLFAALVERSKQLTSLNRLCPPESNTAVWDLDGQMSMDTADGWCSTLIPVAFISNLLKSRAISLKAAIRGKVLEPSNVAEAMSEIAVNAAQAFTGSHIISPQSLYHFAAGGNFPGVQALLRAKVHPGFRDVTKHNVLMAASRGGHSRVVQLLLDNGAELLARNDQGEDSLILASKEGHFDLISLLIAAGADVHVRDFEGRSPIMWAAVKGWGHAAKALLRLNANVEDENLEGSVLALAVQQQDNEKLVKILVDSNANVDKKNRLGISVLMTAVKLQHQQSRQRMVETLLSSVEEIDATNDDGQTALSMAAQNAADELVAAICGAGAAVGSLDSSGWNALHHAARAGSAPCVEILLANKAEVNSRTYSGNTSLMLAANENHLAAMSTLLVGGAEIDLQNTKGWTALMTAAQKGYTSIVEELLAKNASVNLVTAAKESALMHAAGSDNVSVVQLLLESGANGDLLDVWSSSAYDLAERKNLRQICRTLRAHGFGSSCDSHKHIAAYRVTCEFHSTDGDAAGAGAGAGAFSEDLVCSGSERHAMSLSSDAIDRWTCDFCHVIQDGDRWSCKPCASNLCFACVGTAPGAATPSGVDGWLCDFCDSSVRVEGCYETGPLVWASTRSGENTAGSDTDKRILLVIRGKDCKEAMHVQALAEAGNSVAGIVFAVTEEEFAQEPGRTDIAAEEVMIPCVVVQQSALPVLVTSAQSDSGDVGVKCTIRLATSGPAGHIDFASLAKQKGKDGQWTDPDMNHSFGVLLNYLRQEREKSVGMSWRRPGEIHEKACLLGDLESSTAIQGQIGNCWLLGPMNSFPDSSCLRQLFVSTEFFWAGLVGVRLYWKGRWVDVAVDTRIPTQKGQPLFARASAPHSFWPCFLEKAIAKVKGGYIGIDTGFPTDAMMMLTGSIAFHSGVSEYFGPALAAARATQDEHGEVSVGSVLEDCLVQCSTSTNNLELGIYAGLSFTFHQFLSVSTGDVLVQLSSTWGKAYTQYWQGDWNHRSSKWAQHPEVAEECKHEDPDVKFWMTAEDFLRLFDTAYICKLPSASSCMYLLEGEWTNSLGCVNDGWPAWATNPQVRLTMQERSTLSIALSQDPRDGKLDHSILFEVLRCSPGKARKTRYAQRDLVFASDCVLGAAATKPVELEEGEYAIVPQPFDPVSGIPFRLRIISSSPIQWHEDNLNEENVRMSRVEVKAPNLINETFDGL